MHACMITDDEEVNLYLMENTLLGLKKTIKASQSNVPL